MKTTTVQVRYSGNGYTARAGRGKKAKTASSTHSPAVAAQRAAAKAFGLDDSNVQTADSIEVSGRFTHDQGGTYQATLPDLPAVYVTIKFEDHGQDFLEWDVAADGVVLNSRPFQSWVWGKGTVRNITELTVGGKVKFKTDQGDELTMKYPVASLEKAEA